MVVLTERERLASGADFSSLPRAMGVPAVSGVIRKSPADFIVRESLAFELTGSGEHLYLLVRKTGQNTRWVARQLARNLDLPMRAIGFAGLKDRRAITEQWFSLHLPGQADPDLAALDIEGVEFLESRRHSGKLRTGALLGNSFRLVLRELRGERADLEARLQALHSQRVPNYFGQQRFGHGGGNLMLFKDFARPASLGREARSFALSALRSALFNNYLALRIRQGSWHSPLPGEIVWLPTTQGYAHEPDICGTDVAGWPTGLLWGQGVNQSTDIARATEDQYFAAYAGVCQFLDEQEVRMMRRSLVAEVKNIHWQFTDTDVTVQFDLLRGQYATAVLRELGSFVNAEQAETDRVAGE